MKKLLTFLTLLICCNLAFAQNAPYDSTGQVYWPNARFDQRNLTSGTNSVILTDANLITCGPPFTQGLSVGNEGFVLNTSQNMFVFYNPSGATDEKVWVWRHTTGGGLEFSAYNDAINSWSTPFTFTRTATNTGILIPTLTISSAVNLTPATELRFNNPNGTQGAKMVFNFDGNTIGKLTTFMPRGQSGTNGILWVNSTDVLPTLIMDDNGNLTLQGAFIGTNSSLIGVAGPGTDYSYSSSPVSNVNKITQSDASSATSTYKSAIQIHNADSTGKYVGEVYTQNNGNGSNVPLAGVLVYAGTGGSWRTGDYSIWTSGGGGPVSERARITSTGSLLVGTTSGTVASGDIVASGTIKGSNYTSVASGTVTLSSGTATITNSNILPTTQLHLTPNFDGTTASISTPCQGATTTGSAVINANGSGDNSVRWSIWQK